MEKKSNSKLLWVIVGVMVVLAIGVTTYALTSSDESTTNNASEQTAEEMGMTDEEHANMDAEDEATTSATVIVFTNDGFNPNEYTSKEGEEVTVRNDSDMDLEFSSDDHPTHRDNPELNMAVLSPGESGMFTPPGKGTYGFHDHINDEFTGSITVQ